jgi:hypothetical protein
MKAGYRPAFKSVKSWQSDKVQASASDDNIIFKTETGVPATKQNEDIIIRIQQAGHDKHRRRQRRTERV